MITRPGGQVTGRDSELALLTGTVADLRAGRGRSVLIEGEPGIGKSALLSVLLASLDTSECQVVRGECDELTERFPLAAVAGALGRFSGDRQAEVERVLAGLGQGTQPGLVPGDPALGAVEELLGLIHRLATGRPLVLALEDMHWADEASVLLWRRLCRVTAQIPLLLIGTRRLLPRGAPLARDVVSSGGLVISLAGLPAGEVERMAADLAGGAPGPRLLRWLEPAAGNPFYVRELLDAALRSGALQAASTGGEVELSGQADAGQRLGGQVTSLRQAIASRLDFLAADELRVLRIASLLGPDFPVTDLAAVTGQTPADLLPVIEDAIAGGLLEEAGPRLRFRHGLLQQALYEGMPASLRAALHRQAAQSLAGLGAPAERIARQLLAVPDLGEDWETGWLAAHAATLAGRVPEVAATLLEQTLRGLIPPDPRRTVLEDHLTSALFMLGRFEEVEKLTAAVLPEVTDPDRSGRLTWMRGYALVRARRHEDGIAALAATAARLDTGPVWRARFLALRAMMLPYTGDTVAAAAAADAALAAADGLGDATALAYSTGALIAGHRDDWPEAHEQLAALKSRAEQYTPNVAWPRSNPRVTIVAATALESEAAGDPRAAVDLLASWLEPGREQQLTARYKLLPTLTRLALGCGDEATAQAAARATRLELDREPRTHRQAIVDWCAGLVNVDPAPVRAAAGTLGELGLPLEAGNALEDAAVLFAQTGEMDTARSVLDEALAGYDRLGAAWDARRAVARIRTYGVRAGARGTRGRPQTGWPSLTSTETQVAELLAEGKSNPDIAAQLFVSRRTVESHVSHILAKLQLTSRWEVKAAAE